MFKSFAKISCATLLVLLCAACSTTELPPMLARPSSIDNIGVRLTPDAELSRREPYRAHLNAERTILYEQHLDKSILNEFLGPLGVYRNRSSAEAITAEDRSLIYDKLQLSPLSIFSQAAASQNLTPNAYGFLHYADITPYVYITRDEIGQLYMAAAIIVKHNTFANWEGRYFYQIDSRYNLHDLYKGLNLEQQRGLQNELRSAFGAALLLYRADRDNELHGDRVRVATPLLGADFEVYVNAETLPSDPSRFNFRTLTAVYSVPYSNARISESD